MAKDLTVSDVDRQNILNNPYALQKMQEHLDLKGSQLNGEWVFTKSQVAELLEVEIRTIERYLSSNGEELKENGYRLLKGKQLETLRESFVTDIDVGHKTRSLGLFSFRAVLNLAMLLTESNRAKYIRSRMLDIFIDVVAERSGGHTKYINQRDDGYLFASFQEQNYRKKFTDALLKCADKFPFKYQTFTDRVYQSIFKEKAEEYRKILKLHQEENVRDTMYSEILVLISSYENGLAHVIESEFNKIGKKLSYKQLKQVFDDFERNPAYEPLVTDARTKMASRDQCFRDALHDKLEHYIHTVPEGDFERFLGEKSKALEERITETKDVFKRLKDR